MIAAHNNDYSCVITGSSVHNERVERLWRDFHSDSGVTSIDALVPCFPKSFDLWKVMDFSTIFTVGI